MRGPRLSGREREKQHVCYKGWTTHLHILVWLRESATLLWYPRLGEKRSVQERFCSAAVRREVAVTSSSPFRYDWDRNGQTAMGARDQVEQFSPAVYLFIFSTASWFRLQKVRDLSRSKMWKSGFTLEILKQLLERPVDIFSLFVLLRVKRNTSCSDADWMSALVFLPRCSAF